MANREYEDQLLSEGYKVIAGTDEAGRGPLAGPVVIAAVIFPNGYTNPEINDSKKLTPKKRKELVEVIKKDALKYSITVIDVETIDKINIYEASRLGMYKCIEKFKGFCDAVITDCMPLPKLNIKVLDLVKGDAKSVTVAAASILAKETRDEMLIELDKKYPNYGFKDHKGYGTKKHIEALNQYGFIEGVHRKTYEPIKSMINNQLKFDI